MKLHHTVNHFPSEYIATSIEANGLIPQIADVYADLVPEKVRDLPVVWLAEKRRRCMELPVFELDSESLDQDRLYPVNIVYEADKKLKWWIYQGSIPANVLSRVEGETGGKAHSQEITKTVH